MKRTILVSLSLVIIILVLCAFLFQKVPKGEDRCERLMIERNVSYLLCGMENGKILAPPPSNRYLLSSGQYVSLWINPQKLLTPFDSFYVCIFLTPSLSQLTSTLQTISSGVLCSTELKKGSYFPIGISGYVKKEKEKSINIKVYLFNGSLPSNFDFKNNIDKGIKIIEIEGWVE
jgi:hypothetical protein